MSRMNGKKTHIHTHRQNHASCNIQQTGYQPVWCVCVCVCVCVLHIDRSGLMIWPAEQGREPGLARRVRPSRPALARSLSTPWLNLIGWFLPLSSAASIHLLRHPPSGQSRVYRVAQLRTDGVFTATRPRPVVLKVSQQLEYHITAY